MKKLVATITLILVLSFSAETFSKPEEKTSSIYNFPLKTIDGQTKTLQDYQGKVLLVVNTASECGFTPQYKALESLYKKYKDRGFVVLGFPSNNFGGQEPGSDQQIKVFCEKNYQVSFPLFSKVDVKGQNTEPLFAFLTKKAGGSILWNFEKFIIDRKGQFVDRFRSITKPDSKKILVTIDQELAK